MIKNIGTRFRIIKSGNAEMEVSHCKHGRILPRRQNEKSRFHVERCKALLTGP